MVKYQFVSVISFKYWFTLISNLVIFNWYLTNTNQNILETNIIGKIGKVLVKYRFIPFSTFVRFSLRNSGAKYVAIKCWGRFRIFQLALAMHQQKICQRLSGNLCKWPCQWLRHTLAFCQGLWFGFLTVDTTYLIYIILFTCNTFKWEKQKTMFLLLITLSWFLHVSLL